jgi:hypothetical protein
MLKQKNIGMIGALAAAIALSACQPQKAEPQPEAKPAKTEAPEQRLKLAGDTEKLSRRAGTGTGANRGQRSRRRF